MPYLSFMFLGMLAAAFAGYLTEGRPVFKAQSAGIVIVLVTFGVTLAFWLALRVRAHVSGTARLFLLGMGALWVVHMGMAIFHHDLFNHTVWTFIPFLALVWLKPPNAREGWAALWALAWGVAVVLVLTRSLEIFGVLEVKSVPESITEFEQARYWLPFSGHLGLEGRWPGPFGHNADTGMMGALIAIVAIVNWRRTSPILIAVGALTLLLTGGRGPQGAIVVSLAILLIFSRRGRLAMVPLWARVTAAIAMTFAVIAALVGTGAGLTGRDVIWSEFLPLWRESPWLGIGTTGISENLNLTRGFTHAHNMLLDELVRYGLLTTLLLVAVLLVGAVLPIRAAARGYPGPLAILCAYGVLTVTEVRNNWQQPSILVLLVITCVLIANSWLADHQETAQSPSSITTRT